MGHQYPFLGSLTAGTVSGTGPDHGDSWWSMLFLGGGNTTAPWPHTEWI